MSWNKKITRISGEMARRITGISHPFGGVQWADPGPSQRERVRTFMLALEDRRVLFNPEYLEVRHQVEQSVLQIRQLCTDSLQSLGETDFGVIPIRSIRAACRKFNDEANFEFRNFSSWPDGPNPDYGFFAALGAFRAVVGQQLAVLAAHYDIDVEGDLARIFPPLDNENDE